MADAINIKDHPVVFFEAVTTPTEWLIDSTGNHREERVIPRTSWTTGSRSDSSLAARVSRHFGYVCRATAAKAINRATANVGRKILMTSTAAISGDRRSSLLSR